MPRTIHLFRTREDLLLQVHTTAERADMHHTPSQFMLPSNGNYHALSFEYRASLCIFRCIDDVQPPVHGCMISVPQVFRRLHYHCWLDTSNASILRTCSGSFHLHRTFSSSSCRSHKILEAAGPGPQVPGQQRQALSLLARWVNCCPERRKKSASAARTSRSKAL